VSDDFIGNSTGIAPHPGRVENGCAVRSGPRNLDSALSEIFLGFQAANSGVTCS
jgi:hypothetical protein